MILISAGHYPEAKGASFGNFNEHDEAVIWAKLIAAMLGKDALVIPTGTPRQKIDFINEYHKRIPVTAAIEIHFNSAMDSQGNHVGSGCETLFCPGSMRGHVLAEAVHAQLIKVFKPDRGIKEGWYKMDPMNGPDAFLSKTAMPAIIMEPEFIHRVDNIKNHREEGCFAIAHGLESFLLEKD